MKKKEIKTIRLPKVEPPSFFKENCLVFTKSNHILRLSNGYYRCDLDCRGKCEEKERQFKKESFERKFSRFANKFKITNTGAENIVKRLLKDTIIKIIDEDDFGNEEIMETTMDVMKQDLKKKKKLKKSDLEDFEEALIHSHDLDYPIVLMAYISGMVRSFSLKENTVEIGRDLALITKKIYISKTGEIESIEFEKWGWYILNYIDKKFPNYLHNLKEQEVNIINKYDEILDLDLDQAVEYFSGENFEEALHNHSISFFYSIFDVMKKMIKSLTDGDPEKIQTETLKMFNQFTTNPAIQLALAIAPLANVKIKGRKK